MAFLELRAISKRYRESPAVDRLDLEIEQGEFVVLLGPSGCGKTTTLRIIAGLEIQSEGSVVLDGRDISDVPPDRRDMAMVFQNLALYPHMRVFDNIAFYLRNIHTSRAAVERMVHEACATVGIEELLQRFPHELSGGERQRVALARALVRQPKVFLLDEPLSALDAKLRWSMRSEIKLLYKRLNNESGRRGTFVYVTHDQVEALRLGTRVVVMNNGRAVQIGSPDELYREPRNLFAATFVGSPAMNVIEGRIEKTIGGAEFRFGDYRVELPARAAQAIHIPEAGSMPAALGIRPDALRLISSPATTALPGTVISVELMGQSHLVTAEVGDYRLACLVDGRSVVEEGAVIGLELPLDAIHLFDSTTGDALLVKAA